jgi:hypothetical protein
MSETKKAIEACIDACSAAFERAYALVEEHGDADMGHEELLELLLQNDIPHAIALHVAEDVRPQCNSTTN